MYHAGIHGVFGDEVDDTDGVGLTETMAAVFRLRDVAGDPVEFGEEDGFCRGEGQSRSGGSDLSDEDAGEPVLKLANCGVFFFIRHTAVQLYRGKTVLARGLTDGVDDGTMVCEDDDFFFLFKQVFDHGADAGELVHGDLQSCGGELGEGYTLEFGDVFSGGFHSLEHAGDGIAKSRRFAGGDIELDDLPDFLREIGEDFRLCAADHAGSAKGFVELGGVGRAGKIPRIPFCRAVPDTDEMTCAEALAELNAREPTADSLENGEDIHRAVDNGSSGEEQTSLRLNSEARFCALRKGILEVMRLIENREIDGRGVGESGDGPFIGEHVRLKRGPCEPFFEFAAPVEAKRRGADNHHDRGMRAVDELCDLCSFAAAGLIGENRGAVSFCEFNEAADAFELVGAESWRDSLSVVILLLLFAIS